MFANTIKNILDDYKKLGKNLTQNDLANVLGMTKQSFSKQNAKGYIYGRRSSKNCKLFGDESNFKRGKWIYNKLVK